ncbi:uncharacterized protein LOC127161682 [Labeo rohita]|uniref:uncharacterized protein LOC127161682 n=1 Tax=Labeo rohita TaxID=84645 RepID=UPI0021E24BD7|nr:uncharacterized protein LOC127161682 [Labeo rohita]
MMYHLAIVLLISAVTSQATTGGFRKCFPQDWVNADQVRVSCNNTQIAQHCSPDHQSCRNMSRPGVFLEKDEHGVCLTITNCSYDSWSCQAMSYTNGNEDKQNFTATCNYDCGLLQFIRLVICELIICGPNICRLIVFGLIVFGPIVFWPIVFWPIIFGPIIGLYFLCTKCFNKNQDMAGMMELEEVRVNGATGETGEMEEMTANGATGVIREREEMAETGEKKEDDGFRS